MNKTALLGKTFRAKMRKAIEQAEATSSLAEVERMLTEALEEPRSDLERFLTEQLHNEEIRLDWKILRWIEWKACRST